MTKRRTTKSASKANLGPETRILLLYGPEMYLRTKYVQQLRDKLAEAHGEVEVIRLEGASTTPAEVLDEVRAFSLMSQYKVVVVDDADQLVRADSNREIMERYAEAPVDMATLVLRADSWRWTKIQKLIDKVGAAIKCEEPSFAAAASFCVRRCESEHGCTINRDAADLLVEQVGRSLSKLDSELSRLALMADPKKGIDRDLVRQEVGLSREERAWEIQSAVLSGDAGRAIGKVRELIEVSRQPAILINFALSDLARKLYAASRMKSAGAPDNVIASNLRLWGDARSAILGAVQRAPAPRFAELMHDAMNVDTRSKTGRGDAARSLELLVIRFLSILHASGR